MPKHLLFCLVLAFSLISAVYCSPLLAENEAKDASVLFLSPAPDNAIGVVENALLSEKWTIVEKLPAMISAEKASRAGRENAKIKIDYRDGELWYMGNGTSEIRKIVAPGKFSTVTMETNIPNRWLTSLRNEVQVLLAESSKVTLGDSDHSVKSFSAKPNTAEKSANEAGSDSLETEKSLETIEQRLDKLQNLLDKGYISDKEYRELRDKILDSI